MNNTDDLKAWRAFINTAQCRSLTKAAEILDVEPSTLSRSIAKLERSLGCELIQHNVRPLGLTENGKKALKRMRTILRAHDSLIDSLRIDKKNLSGRIRLSNAQGFATRQLMPILRKFNEIHPDISFDILTGAKEADVAQGVCDVAVLTGCPTQKGLVYKSRGRNIYLAVASPEYVAKNSLPITPQDLRVHTGFLYTGPVREESKNLFRDKQEFPIQFRNTIRSTNILTIRDAVLKGMGVAVDLPLVQIYEDLLKGTLVPILPGWAIKPIECFIVTNRDSWHNKRIRLFVEWYATMMQKTFAEYESKIGAIVGLPPDVPELSREKIYMT